MKKFLILISILTVVPVNAQVNQISQADLSKMILALQNQRNQVMDALASADVKITALQDELVKAQTKIKDYENKNKDQPK